MCDIVSFIVEIKSMHDGGKRIDGLVISALQQRTTPHETFSSDGTWYENEEQFTGVVKVCFFFFSFSFMPH